MNDRALLESAARAAGIDAEVHCEELGIGDEGLWLKGERSPDNSKYWNPLRCDGDALRLAVAVGIAVTPFTGSKVTRASCLGELLDVDEEHGCDPFAATRRAIVIAAAALGEKHGVA